MRRWLIVPLALAVLATGCSKSEPENVYRIPLLADVKTLDPIRVTDTTSHAVASQIFNTLVRYRTGEDGKMIMVGDLAERWEILDGGTRYLFHLRSDVKFHHGRLMVAADVKKSLQRLMDKSISQRPGNVAPIIGAKEVGEGKAASAEGIRVVDSQTVEIRLTKPNAAFLMMLSMVNAAVIPIEEVERLGDKFSTHPVGTGPFKIKQVVRKKMIELERFDDYFLGPAKLAGIRYLIRKEPSIALQEYRKGLFEHVAIPKGLLGTTKAGEMAGQLREYETLSVFYIGFHMKKEPWQGNPKLRQALNWAINRKVLCEKTLEGRFIPARGPLPPGLSGFNEELAGYGYDPERARQLLTEAGFPGGQGLPALMLSFNPEGPNNKLVVERIQSDLKKIGVEITLSSIEWTTYIDRLDKGELLLFRLGWSADYPDADTFLYPLFHSTQHGKHGNATFYEDADVDMWLDQARAAVDAQQRLALYRMAEAKIVKDAPWLFVGYGRNHLLVQSYVKGLRLGPMDSGTGAAYADFHQVSLER